MFGRFGWAEILIIVVLVIVLFGSGKIPGMMKNLADGLNIFKKEITKQKSEHAPAMDSAKKPASKAKAAVKKPVTKTLPKANNKKTVSSSKKTVKKPSKSK